MIGFIKMVVVVSVFIFIAVSILLYLKQDALVFAGAYILKDKIDQNEIITNGTKQFSINADDNVKLYGSITQNKSDTLMIYFGGNAENVTVFVSKLSFFKKFDTVSLNYRGYGKSEGTPSEELIFSDALMVYEYFKNRYKNIFIVGRSLGTAPATYLASQKQNSGLILITPFDSILNVAKESYPFFPIKKLLRSPFDLTKHIQKVQSNISILMVENDSIISNKRTLALLKNIKNTKTFKKIHNSGHNEIMEDSRLLQFIKQAIASN